MLDLLDNKYCCGCSACQQICPKQCIKMIYDDEGFLYPFINKDTCVNCGICNKVCPLNDLKRPSREPIETYAAINPIDSVRLDSSSGGIFIMLAEYVIKHNGIVFGARFDERWNVIHDFAEDINQVKHFVGSKYLQCDMSNSFSKAKEFLDSERIVLFSGTPCQIGGLKSFLKKEYSNLISIDFICHGTPSPGVWQKYVKRFNNTSKISKISFRDKTIGWNHFSLTLKDGDNKIIYTSPFQEDPYMQLFLQNVILRPSCYDCKFRQGRSGSDITLADFWHIDEVIPNMYDDKGASLVLVNSTLGQNILDQVSCNLCNAPFDSIRKFNNAWYDSYPIHPYRTYFFDHYKKRSIPYLYKRTLHPELLLRNKIKNKIRTLVRKILSICKNRLISK